MFLIGEGKGVVLLDEGLRVFFIITAERVDYLGETALRVLQNVRDLRDVNELLCFYSQPAKRFVSAISRVLAGHGVLRFR